MHRIIIVGGGAGLVEQAGEVDKASEFHARAARRVSGEIGCGEVDHDGWMKTRGSGTVVRP